MEYTQLTAINSPADLRQCDESNLGTIAAELRQFLLESVSMSGGHLSAGLGTVELTVALHYVFNTPEDRLVWDVGHQAYPHKILTGRREEMHTIRKTHGLSGFLKRSESQYDCFGAGHSSTSISAALGMAVASRQRDEDRQIVAIIGDGALSAGMAYEALNNAGDIRADMLVILNDNDISISPNVGAISNYLTRILSGRTYTTMREGSKTVLSTIKPVHNLVKRCEEHIKGMVSPSTLFEELGFHYFGPIDGHDLPTLVSTLRNLSMIKGPRFLHVVTQKGKGYDPAEADPCRYHGVGPFDPNIGMEAKKSSDATYSQIFGQWLCDMAEEEPELIAITPAMGEGSGMLEFAKAYPERYFDVGIAEQHAVTFAAGLACEQVKPVVAIYSTFLQRGYDQLLHDVAIQNLDVTFAIDRSGLVGADGDTHNGAFDYSYMRCIPNLVLLAPSDVRECRDMLYTAYHHSGPAAVRYPRGGGPAVETTKEMRRIPIGKAEIKRIGNKLALLAFGSMLVRAEEVADALESTLVNMRFIKPLDRDLILEMAEHHQLLVTIEENVVAGGAGSAVNELLNEAGCHIPVLNLGLPDTFVSHGDPNILLAEVGLNVQGIQDSILSAYPHLFPTAQQTA